MHVVRVLRGRRQQKRAKGGALDGDCRAWHKTWIVQRFDECPGLSIVEDDRRVSHARLACANRRDARFHGQGSRRDGVRLRRTQAKGPRIVGRRLRRNRSRGWRNRDRRRSLTGSVRAPIG